MDVGRVSTSQNAAVLNPLCADDKAVHRMSDKETQRFTLQETIQESAIPPRILWLLGEEFTHSTHLFIHRRGGFKCLPDM
jgi:hypothetical protein